MCWQAEIISDLLFSKQLSFSFKILSFSSQHKLHLLDPSVQEIDFFIIDHFMVKSVLFCFRCQMCFESSVSFEYFLCVKDLI